MDAGREGCLSSKIQEYSKLLGVIFATKWREAAGLMSTSWNVQKKQGGKEEGRERGEEREMRKGGKEEEREG